MSISKLKATVANFLKPRAISIEDKIEIFEEVISLVQRSDHPMDVKAVRKLVREYVSDLGRY